ncbi:hypothetical protein GALMADRAFT_1327154 [Galerina marginata CBS 339.88]|uniref:Uncharacterized protein n=1 Tax=Galerina marginata (strain CBS 339.88) TaxID=685588 RepID=A0A067TAV7_GALM3|nr:hypothetical protein GALMADRAFT_1327154 [Galerina marginata CBS 339.88]
MTLPILKRFLNLFTVSVMTPPTVTLDYELPKTVVSVRDGWQWTCQSGAVVDKEAKAKILQNQSGLLASVAAQLLTLFKTPAPSPSDSSSNNTGQPTESLAQTFLLVCCYAAIFLNISATISSFILIDNLGEIGYRSSIPNNQRPGSPPPTTMSCTPEKLLYTYGASSKWTWMLFHWLFTFYMGILTLLIAIFTYVIMNEKLATKIAMALVFFINFLFVTFFIFIRPLTEKS